MGIKEEGFLSQEIEKWIKHIREQFCEYFALCDKLNAFGQTIMLGVKVHSGYAYEVLLGCLLERTMGHFQSVVLLSERGMVSQAKAMLRCLIEAMFVVVAVSRDKTYSYALVRNHIFNRKKAIKACKRNAEADVALFNDEQITNLEETENKIQSEINKSSVKQITVRDIAEKAGLIKYYDSAYLMLSGVIHVDMKELENIMERDKGGKLSGMLWGPSSSEINIILLDACDAIFRVLDGIFNVFNIEEKTKKHWLEKFKELEHVYRNLPV